MKIQVPLSPWEETTPARCSEMPTPKDFCSFTPFRSSRNVENEYNSPAKYSETKARTPLSDLGSNANVRPTAVAASPAKRPIVLTPHPSKDRVQLVMNVEESAGVDTSEADALRERVACLEAQLADAMAQLAKTIAPVSLAIHVVEPVDESSKQEAEDLRAQVAALKREAHQLREQAAAATAAKANVSSCTFSSHPSISHTHISSLTHEITL